MYFFLACKGLSIDDVGVAKGIVFQEIRPGAGFKAGDFVQEKLRGATVVRVGANSGRSRSGVTLPRSPITLP